MEFERPSSNLKNIDDGAGNHNELQEESQILTPIVQSGDSIEIAS